MGNLIAPPKDSVVLVPPRFETRGLMRPVVVENPMTVLFGNLFRREVLYDLHNFNGSVSLDVLLAPEVPVTMAAHLGMSGSSLSKTVDGGTLNLYLHKKVSEKIGSLCRMSLSPTLGFGGYGVLSYAFKPDCRFSTVLSEKSIGLRCEGNKIFCGLDVPLRVPRDTSTWFVSNVWRNIWIGASLCPLNPEVISSFSASVEKRIPHTDSSYCVSGNVDVSQTGPPQLTVGFSQHLVTHRKVYNPFEEARWIANYVDIVLEATGSAVSAGVGWQPNKNFLTKIHVSTDKGVLATLVARNWWIPSVLASVSAGVDNRGQRCVGARLQVSNWAASGPQYQKGVPGNAVAPTLRYTHTHTSEASV